MPVKSTKEKKSVTSKAKVSKKAKVEVSEVKKVRTSRSKNMVDLRQPAKKEAVSQARHVLTVRQAGVEKKSALKALEDMPKFEIKHQEPASDAVIKHFDFDDKIDFKQTARSVQKPLHIYRKISISFIILTLILLAAMAYFSLVKVDISVVLNKGQVTGSTSLNVVSGQIASSTDKTIAGLVKEVDVEQTKEFESTGKQILGTEVNGRVKIVNNYVRNQPLVANTRLVTADNQLVRVKTTVNVPSGGSVEVDVYSSDASSSVNIPVGVRLMIPGLWKGVQDKIYAESITSITYQENVKKIVTAEDIAAVAVAMQAEIENKVKNEIVPAYQAQYSKVLYKVVADSFESSVDAKPQEEKPTYSAKAKEKIIIVGFAAQDAAVKAQEQLVSQLVQGKSLINFDAPAMTYDLGNIDVAADSATVSAGYAGTVVSTGQMVIDKSRILALTANQLEEYLRGLPDIGHYEIKFTPSFLGRVPYLINRINISVSN